MLVNSIPLVGTSNGSSKIGATPLSSLRNFSAVEQALRQARILHRASKNVSILVAMPAVRRAHAAGVLAHLTLSALYRQRHLLQRKHFLRTLAFEAGFANWESYLLTLRNQTPQALEQYTTMMDIGYPNAWFSTHEQAVAFAQENGGTLIRYGRQAMVVRPEIGAFEAEVQHDS